MPNKKVVITDYTYENIDVEKSIFAEYAIELYEYQVKAEDDVIKAAADCDVLIVQYSNITRKVIESLKNCKAIIRYAIGVDNIDVEAASENGIYVVNVPDYGVDEVSTYTVALLLSMARRIPETLENTRKGKWDYSLVKPLFRTSGQCLGLVGLGMIPTKVAEKMAKFGMRILAYDPYVDLKRAEALGVELVDFDTLIELSDYVSIHCPLTAETNKMFDINIFRKMKKTSYLINTARGAIINEKDLVTACSEKIIAGAAIDVAETEPISADSPLLALPNVIVTPHMAWYSEQAILDLKESVAQEAVRVANNEMPKNIVNRKMLKLQ